MATNLQLDDRLIRKAVKLGGHRTKKDAVTQALTNYIRHLEQAKILSLFGRVDFDSDYDYKRQRAKGRESSWIRGNGRQPIRTKAANSSTVAVPIIKNWNRR